MGNVFTVREAARYLRVRPQLVYRLLNSGRLKGAKIGGVWRIPAVAFDSLLGVNEPGQSPIGAAQ